MPDCSVTGKLRCSRLSPTEPSSLSRTSAYSTSCASPFNSRSAFDFQPVLDALSERASRLCGADDVSIFKLEGERLPAIAHRGPLRYIAGYATPAVRGTVSGLCAERR